MIMQFEKIEKDIEELNKINVNASYKNREKYISIYQDIYNNLVEMERTGQIEIEEGKKSVSYLQEILINDGPEYAYTIMFWQKGDKERKYKIGVCVRGLPIVKRIG